VNIITILLGSLWISLQQLALCPG